MADEVQRWAVSLEGEIVEIIEAAGVSSLRVALHHMIRLDLPASTVAGLHLGDRIGIDGALRVDRLHALPDVDPSAPRNRASSNS